MSSSAIYGILILFGAVAMLILFMLYKREQDYKIAMEKYERDMEAYNKAVALYGDPSLAATVPAPVAAASVAVPATSVPPVVAAPTTSSGEVLLSGVDEPTAAMIIAILCNELGQNPAALRFKSITAM